MNTKREMQKVCIDQQEDMFLKWIETFYIGMMPGQKQK